MNKGEKSIYTAITSIVYTVIYGLLSLVVIRLVIKHYGSDFNGINSSASQFVGVLLILEGGFAMAINVALFKPIATKDIERINSILSAAKRIFTKVGLAVLIIGIPTSLGYSFLVKSSLPWYISTLTFIMVVIPTAFNLAYATKYIILLQTEQREYILNSIKIATIALSQGVIIIVIYLEGHMLLVRFATMVGAIISSVLIALACRKRYKYLDLNKVPDYTSIKGTKDVLAQRVTGMIYGTIPILFISATVGTMYASVYAVYSGVFMLLKNVISAFTGAPRMGFGQLIAERDKNYVNEVFKQYEFIVILSMFCFLSVTVVLIMPFIKLYTEGVSDINYLNWSIAGLFIGTSFFEIIHLPSGNILNMAGKFKRSRNIQIVAAIVLIISMVIGNYFFGFYGILGAVFITAVLLAFLEITYIHNVYFVKGGLASLRGLVPNFIISLLLILLEISILPDIQGYLKFALIGIILVLINGSVLVAFNYLINKPLMINLSRRLYPLADKFVETYFSKSDKGI